MRARLMIAMLLSPVLASAQSFDLGGLADKLSGSVSALLQGQLDIDEEQAEGGLGTILSMAKQKLDAGDFDQIAGLIPGASEYIDAAKRLGTADGLENLDDLTAAFEKLGLDEETMSKFVPVVADFVAKMGGTEMQNMLLGALDMAG